MMLRASCSASGSDDWSTLLTAMLNEPRSWKNFWNVRTGIVTKRSWLCAEHLALRLRHADDLEIL